jgi:hypothetical protein
MKGALIMTFDPSLVKVETHIKGNQINFGSDPSKKEFKELLVNEIVKHITTYYESLDETNEKIKINIENSLKKHPNQFDSAKNMIRFGKDGVFRDYINDKMDDEKKLNNLSNKIFNEFEQLKYLGECYDLLINLRGQRKQIITSIQELEKFKKKNAIIGQFKNHHKKDIKTFDFILSIKVRIKYNKENYSFIMLKNSFTNAKYMIKEFDKVSLYSLTNIIDRYIVKDSNGEYKEDKNGNYLLDDILISKIKIFYIKEIKNAINKEIKRINKFRKDNYDTKTVYGHFL